MHGVAVAVLGEDRERLNVLQNSVDSTGIGRVVYTHVGFPLVPTDPSLRQIQDLGSEVVLVDVDPQNPQRAFSAIELIHASTADITIFVAGAMDNPQTIVAAMRAGAREYLDRNADRDALLECLTRLSSARSKKMRSGVGKAKVFTFVNAKGGAGATTVAVNTGIALQEAHGKVVLVDFAPVGCAALHLNLRPTFGLYDALQNLHRMDASLLEGFMTQYKGGLHLLAGPQQPYPVPPTAAELARLFDLLVSHYQYVIIDCSSRLDQTTRMLSDLSNAVLLVTQTDVVSLWSAGRLRGFLEEGGRDRVRLLLNRYKKIPGFSDEDLEKATNCKVLWKVPNNYQLIAPAIDNGTPVALHHNQEVSHSFVSLAAVLAQAAAASDGALDLVYQHDKNDPKKKAVGRLLISPLRAGQ